MEPVDVRYPGLRLATFCGVFYLVLGLVYGGHQVLLGVGHGSDLIELVDGGVEGQCCWWAGPRLRCCVFQLKDHC